MALIEIWTRGFLGGAPRRDPDGGDRDESRNNILAAAPMIIALASASACIDSNLDMLSPPCRAQFETARKGSLSERSAPGFTHRASKEN
jgi:hypothetical protein